ncbi:hypothetical protein ACHAPU_006606, partial [Fusarium lateritium]
FEGGIKVLYKTNTFIFHDAKSLDQFHLWTFKYDEEIRSVDLLTEHLRYLALHNTAKRCYKQSNIRIRFHPGSDSDYRRFKRSTASNMDIEMRYLKVCLSVLSSGSRNALKVILPAVMENIVTRDRRVHESGWFRATCIFEDENASVPGSDPESDDEEFGTYVFLSEGDF